MVDVVVFGVAGTSCKKGLVGEMILEGCHCGILGGCALVTGLVLCEIGRVVCG